MKFSQKKKGGKARAPGNIYGRADEISKRINGLEKQKSVLENGGVQGLWNRLNGIMSKARANPELSKAVTVKNLDELEKEILQKEKTVAKSRFAEKMLN